MHTGSTKDVADSSIGAPTKPNKNTTEFALNDLTSKKIFKERNHDITVEEEAEIQRKLAQAKAEIQNLIREGQRLRFANQQLQEDIDLHRQR